MGATSIGGVSGAENLASSFYSLCFLESLRGPYVPLRGPYVPLRGPYVPSMCMCVFVEIEILFQDLVS